MIGTGAGPQVAADRRLAARQHALHAAIALDTALAGAELKSGLSEAEAAIARAVVERTAARFEEWILRDVDPPTPGGVWSRPEHPPVPESEI